MNNVYFFQVSDAFSSRSDQMYLPYAVGTLAAVAWSNPEIVKNWKLKKIICRRESPEKIVARLENPSVAAFSNYVWNYEFNLRTASLLKEKYPSCTVVFGGHNISQNSRLLDKYPFIDVLMFGEGEETFEKLLLFLAQNRSLVTVPNIAYRMGNNTVQTAFACVTGTDYASPYTTGIFDDIIAENPNTSFSAILETNRGCPYHCAFCDWGPMKSKVRMFPMERVKGDIEWFSTHKIDYVWGEDGNFGLFERDREIADMLVQAKKKTGYPQQIKVNYAKLNGENVFYLTKSFAENGLSKSTTMSLQSTSDEALKITGRKNMSNEIFSRLVTVYRHNNIPTYTELVLALPGETKQSFFEGIGRIIENGQHSVIEVYDCIVLPNSTLANPDYIKKYGIETVHLPYVQQHTSSIDNEITEYNETVVSTFSMTAEERTDCRYLAVVVQCFHSMGLLRDLAIWLRREKNISYSDFYTNLSQWLKENRNNSWNLFPDIHRKISLVNDGVNEQYVYDDVFGNVYWPMDEGAFLNIIRHYDEFFEDIKGFVSTLTETDGLILQVLGFCKATVRIPEPFGTPSYYDYDFPAYFTAALENAPVRPEKANCVVDTSSLQVYENFSDYAREIVWFGRRSQKLNVLESDKQCFTVKDKKQDD